MFQVTENWKQTCPGAHAGILAMRGVANPPAHPGLEVHKRQLEEQLRVMFAGQDMGALDTFGPIPAYTAWYRRFNKTYHVLGQLASVAFKGRSLPSAAALVEAMFIAELKNGLLTAGHDLDQLRLPVTLGIAGGDERYVLLRGQEQAVKAGDMLMSDGEGVISSIIYGPDQRTRLGPETGRALFAVYAPAGITAQTVQSHLEDICSLVQVVSPAARVELLQVAAAQAE